MFNEFNFILEIKMHQKTKTSYQHIQIESGGLSRVA
jgi:hypothetical protein